MEDVLTEIPPPSRFFQEDLNNFAAPSPPLPAPILLLNPNPNPSHLRPSIFVIAISSPSLSLLHHIPHKTLIGTLILPEISLCNSLEPSPRDRSCHIYAVGTTVLAAVQYPIPADRCRAVARSLLGEIRAERVLVLDSIRGQNYRGRLSRDEALTFKLETLEQRRGGDPVVEGMNYLPSGSVMDGLGAAVLGECQMKRVKGTLCATWPESGRPSAVPLLRSLLQNLGFDMDRSFDVPIAAAGPDATPGGVQPDRLWQGQRRGHAQHRGVPACGRHHREAPKEGRRAAKRSVRALSHLSLQSHEPHDSLHRGRGLSWSLRMRSSLFMIACPWKAYLYSSMTDAPGEYWCPCQRRTPLMNVGAPDKCGRLRLCCRRRRRSTCRRAHAFASRNTCYVAFETSR